MRYIIMTESPIISILSIIAAILLDIIQNKYYYSGPIVIAVGTNMTTVI